LDIVPSTILIHLYTQKTFFPLPKKGVFVILQVQIENKLKILY